jgi:hypothetical protein
VSDTRYDSRVDWVRCVCDAGYRDSKVMPSEEWDCGGPEIILQPHHIYVFFGTLARLLMSFARNGGVNAAGPGGDTVLHRYAPHMIGVF